MRSALTNGRVLAENPIQFHHLISSSQSSVSTKITASAPASGVSRHVTVNIKPEHATTFLGALKTLFNQLVTNPEYKLLEVYRDSKELGVFHWVEDRDGIAEWLAAAQEGSEDYKKYQAVKETLYTKSREERIVERMTGDFFHVIKA